MIYEEDLFIDYGCPLNFEAYAQLAPAPQPLEDFKTIGTSKYEVRYSFKFKNHHTDSQYIEDTRVVQIGDAIVKIIVM